MLGPPSLWHRLDPCCKGAGASFALGPLRPPPRWRGGLLHYGTTEALAALARRPPSLWDLLGHGCVAAGASLAFGSSKAQCIGVWKSLASRPQRPPPRWRGGLLRFGTAEAPAARARGPPLHWYPSGCHRVGAGASFAFGSSRPQSIGMRASLALGPQRPITWAWGRPSLWYHRGPRRVGVGLLGIWIIVDPRKRAGGLLCFWTTEAHAALVQGPPSRWHQQGPRCKGAGAALSFGLLTPPPQGRRGLLRFGTTEALIARARGPPLRLDHRVCITSVWGPHSFWHHSEAPSTRVCWPPLVCRSEAVGTPQAEGVV